MKNKQAVVRHLKTGYNCMRVAVTSEVLAIGVWAYFGVFVRVAVTQHLKLRCPPQLHSVETVQLFDILFNNSYFVPNALGCFIIAVLHNRKDGIINHLRQRTLYTGVATGFCGCLTTFSSWAYGIAVDTFDIGVLSSVLLLVIQIALLQASFMLGLSVSQLLRSLSCSLPTGSNKNSLTLAAGGLHQRGAIEASPCPSLPVISAAGNSCSGSPLPLQNSIPGDLTSLPPSIQMDPNGEYTAHLVEASIGRADTPINSALDESSICSSPGGYPKNQAESVIKESLHERREYCLWLLFFVSLTTAIWLLIIVSSYSVTEGIKNKASYLHDNIDTEMLRSVALAPFGAWLRYSLWHIPGVTKHLSSRLPHMKLPTLAANLVGTLLLSAATTWVQGLYTPAFIVGFCGSLTTASTLILEIHLLHTDDELGRGIGPLRSFSFETDPIRYGIVTFFCGIFLPLFFLWSERR